ncbi:hypothetical protein L1987_15496 [Smallanthus sonchifolius]|uniref:Uncharacterized protein n=1 Tax=Smallanthus sonchifolius TaxID=185202 RepID=A0ACB9J5N2_9ASTR|nr:hypothetical protein L1987_15496 [Smallanthus sonchifolius]
MFEKELQSDIDNKTPLLMYQIQSLHYKEGENEVPKEKEHMLPSLTTHREQSLEDVQGHEKSRKGYELSIFGDDRVNQDSFPLTRKEHPGMHRMRTEVHTFEYQNNLSNLVTNVAKEVEKIRTSLEEVVNHLNGIKENKVIDVEWLNQIEYDLNSLKGLNTKYLWTRSKLEENLNT